MSTRNCLLICGILTCAAAELRVQFEDRKLKSVGDECEAGGGGGAGGGDFCRVYHC